MALEVHQVAAMSLVRRVPEMVEADAEQRPDRSETRDVSAQLVVGFVRLRHHYHRVPAAKRTDAFLQRMIPGRTFLQMRGNRVHVGRIERERNVGSRTARLVDELLQQVMGALRALAFENGLER